MERQGPTQRNDKDRQIYIYIYIYLSLSLFFFCTAKEGGRPPSRARTRTGFLSVVRTCSPMRPMCKSSRPPC